VFGEGAVGVHPPPLEIVVRHVVGRTLVAVAGELDDSTASILRERTGLSQILAIEPPD
jgi:hypothetical protein